MPRNVNHSQQPRVNGKFARKTDVISRIDRGSDRGDKKSDRVTPSESENGNTISRPIGNINSDSGTTEPDFISGSSDFNTDSGNSSGERRERRSPGRPRKSEQSRESGSRKNRRSTPTSESETPIDESPFGVEFSTLFTDSVDAKAIPGTLPKVLQIVFGAVALGGFGDHWNLSDKEAKQFSEAISTAINSMPKARKSAWLNFVKQYFPWISLVGTAATIVYPRVALTNMLRQIEVQNERKSSSQAKTIPFPNGGTNQGESSPPSDPSDQTERIGSSTRTAIDQLYNASIGS